MTDRSILLCDDDPRVLEAWNRMFENIPSVRKLFTVESLEPDDLPGIIDELENRRRLAREGESAGTTTTAFDEASVLLIDFDLIGLRAGGITGEAIAYLARCYSKCGLVIGLNQFGRNPFDLTLKGSPDSFADLNLGSEQLECAGLWEEPFSGFRPWMWPNLATEIAAFQSRVDSIVDRLDAPVLDEFGFVDEVVESLPRDILEYVQTVDGKDVRETTFESFVRASEQGLKPKDQASDDDQVARIAAARLWKWLEQVVLPGQDILVDAPHLTERFPSLLVGDKEDPSVWNATCQVAGEWDGLGINTELLEDCVFKATAWLSRPAWRWSCVAEKEDIPEVSEPWTRFDTDLVFCEDFSAFFPRETAKEFVADLSSPFVRRFVHGPLDSAETTSVDYRPSVRFSL